MKLRGSRFKLSAGGNKYSPFSAKNVSEVYSELDRRGITLGINGTSCGYKVQWNDGIVSFIKKK